MALRALLTRPLTTIGQLVIAGTRELGKIAIFFSQGVGMIFALPLQVAKFLEQVYFIGSKSVFVVCLTGAFTGMVLGLAGLLRHW
jgi:phospholipid/cholesterol/gamma-HCH transport system permease protein